MGVQKGKKDGTWASALCQHSPCGRFTNSPNLMDECKEKPKAAADIIKWLNNALPEFNELNRAHLDAFVTTFSRFVDVMVVLLLFCNLTEEEATCVTGTPGETGSIPLVAQALLVLLVIFLDLFVKPTDLPSAWFFIFITMACIVMFASCEYMREHADKKKATNWTALCFMCRLIVFVCLVVCVTMLWSSKASSGDSATAHTSSWFTFTFSPTIKFFGS